MMATIEPRLIHLLNNSQTPDLPPIQLLPSLGAASADESLSLPPLEPDPNQRGDKPAPSTSQIPPLHAVADDPLANKQVPRTDNAFANDPSGRLTESARPLRLLLENTEANTSTLSLRMIVDDTPESSEDPSTKKRHRALTTKDDFVQLPQPLKKQKSTQSVVPPIIAGLHEPPPNAAVFPPITGSFNDSEALSLGMPKEFGSTGDDRAIATSTNEGDKNTGPTKVKRRAAKPRRKWSDEETNHLLLGVSRHGVGKWTSILEDPDFTFNDRTAGDLKDRFRTCCPDELRGSFTSSSKKPVGGKDGANGKVESTPTSEDGAHHGSVPKPKNSILLENILTEPENANATPNAFERDQPAQSQSHSQSQPDSDSASAPLIKQPRKSRAHRKKMEDLMELGIHGPFKKSHRRERRPFTEQDDKEILEGLDQYGPAWTKIQRDSRYHLSSRQPTDLRDRVRNKYPEIYSRIEKGSFGVKDQNQKGQGGGVLEPVVNTTIEKALHMSGGVGSGSELTLNRSSSREDIMVVPKWVPASSFYESSESLPGLADVFVDMGGLEHPMSTAGPGAGAGAFLSPGEMDISRLLLDDAAHIAGASASGPGEHQQQHLRYGGGGSGGGAGGYENGAGMAPEGRYGMSR